MAKKQMSREGYTQLEEKYDYLTTVKRKEIAEKLQVARSYGDLSENAEYDEAKNEQAILESEIQELKLILENAEVVDDDSISLDQIGMGSVITIRRLDTGKEETMKIVGTNEANLREKKISDESPIGVAAMKKRVGDVFVVDAPVGELTFKVIGISK